MQSRLARLAITGVLALLLTGCTDAGPTPGTQPAAPQPTATTPPLVQPAAPPSTAPVTPQTPASSQAVISSGAPAVEPAPPPASSGTQPGAAAPMDAQTPAPPGQPAALPMLRLENAFPRLPRGALGERPVFMSPVPGSDRVAVVEQSGVIVSLPLAPGATRADVFLDIRGKVSRQGNEEGLLGLAFHPDFGSGAPYVFLYYSAASPRRSVISRFTVSQGAADPATEQVILEVGQPFSNHNGGMIAFGPDGYLYIGLGDGGSGGDPEGHGQNLGTLLGSILRIDVNRQDAGLRYAIPPDNPFVRQQGARGEIWAYGLRNPWRFSFDRHTGALWAADVGQNVWEEVDIVRKGGNYGWNLMEGAHCFRPATGCNQSGLELPVAEYNHDLGCSVTGGYVYRGKAVPALVGAYLYADFCSGRVWALRWDGARVTEHRQVTETGLSIASFAEDLEGELYVLAFDGNVYRMWAAR